MYSSQLDCERVAWSFSASLRLRYLRVRRKQLRRRANFTNVRLPTGNVHLGFENATADFELKAWDAEKHCYWTLCRAGEDVDVSLTKWRKLVGGSSAPPGPTHLDFQGQIDGIQVERRS